MDYKEANQRLDEVIDMLRQNKRTVMEETLQALAASGLSPYESVELRVSSDKLCDPHFVQRAARAMLISLHLYPTSIAVHSTVAKLFEASEVVIRVDLKGNAFRDILEAIYGREFLEKPIHIEIDDSLDTKTVAVRFKMDTENNKEFDDTRVAMLMKMVKGE
jgi:hypothetical protein